MHTKKIYQWGVSLVLFLFLVYACGGKTTIFSWTKIEASNISTRTNDLVSNSVRANEYAIRLDFSIGETYNRVSSGGAIGRAEFFNDVIDSLEITSPEAFNESIEPNRVLNQFFRVRIKPEDQLLTTTQFLRLRKREVRERVELLLVQPPQIETPIRFIVKLNLNFGRALRDTTSAIILRR
jgi:hypothetical protein